MGVHDSTDNGRLPVGVKETLAEFCCECVEGIILTQELFLIVFDPVIDFDILERHEDVVDFIFIADFTFVKVGIEVLNELCEDGGRDRSLRQDGGGFVCVVEFNCCHIEMRGREC